MEHLVTEMQIHRYLNTNGNRPVVVTCNDKNDYVCKHNNASSVRPLLSEYLAYAFLRVWGISTPNAAFIKVEPEHYRDCLNNGLQPICFKNTCFGS